MIAALPMYDWPECQSMNDAFWKLAVEALADEGIAAPPQLDRDWPAHESWLQPDLLVGQACGRPLTLGLCGEAVAFARPYHDVEGCGPGTYRSAIIVRRVGSEALDGYRGTRVAVNGTDSHSGYSALKATLVGTASPGTHTFSEVVKSGAHRASLDLVAGGRADICAIDAVAWALYQELEPERAARLRPIAWSPEAPALPFITAPQFVGHIPALTRALDAAAKAAPRSPCLPVAVLPSTREDYAAIGEMDACGAVVTL
ncbi:PhnD/SsuA/transferrin family substrate-binding protein [Rhodobacteraceae bacterium NNCM2]|nr:PhnD/SsuA/transferrin family substrate-binding protein [Coraliihabitans acroporae]